MSIFGTTHPKIIVNIDTTQDEVLLQHAVVLKDEPELDSYGVKAVRTGKRIFINAGKHWLFQVKIYLWKYADPEAKYLELKDYATTKVYLARHSDGTYFINKNGQTVEFVLESISEKITDDKNKFDYIIITFKSVDYIDLYRPEPAWYEIRPAGEDANKLWYGADLSADGRYIYATIYAGRIHRSSDFGTTWQEIRPIGDQNGYWHNIFCSQDGKFVFVSTNVANGKIYRSANYGDSWTDITPYFLGDRAWGTTYTDYIGVKLIAGSNGRLVRSIDGGVNWTELQPAGNIDVNWYGISCTPDGMKIFVAGYEHGRAYVSEDGGNNWTEVTPFSNVQAWRGCCCNSNFTKLGLCSNAGQVWLSSDSGATWINKTPSAFFDYISINMDASGNTISLAQKGGGIYISTDFGNSWTRQIDAVNREYYLADVNTFGDKFICFAYNGRLWIRK